MSRQSGIAVLLVAAATAGGLAGCGTSAARADIEIVASTDVYASIAEQLTAGVPPTRVGVTAIVADPAVDPHEYEASARNELSVSRADLIIENGGGYDDFVETLRRAAGSNVPVINAVQLSGYAGDADLNEHVWFDLPTVGKVARQITAFLLARDQQDASILRRNAHVFAGEVRRIEANEAQLKSERLGAGVAITEPVALYLLTACGLVNRTPAAFSNAIEEGTDASPRVLQETLDLFTMHEVQLLVVNEQTAGPQTDQVVSAANAAHIPVVGVTETLPGAALTYLDWMTRLVQAVAAVLT
jgi:zinc/manganese transport system substrate-binding protein